MEKGKKRNWLGYATVAGVILVVLAFVTNSNEPQNTIPEVEPTSAVSPTPAEQPSSVTIDAGSPLPCELLDESREIDGVVANYSCSAPGAYLTSIDMSSNTAGYFTTNTQGDTVTYGPETVEVLEVSE